VAFEALDDEPATAALTDQYLLENEYENDFSGKRLRHEIDLPDARTVSLRPAHF